MDILKKIDLAVYYPVKKGGHKCSMSGNGNMFVKEDSDYNLYIHNKTLNNINYCVSIIGASKYIKYSFNYGRSTSCKRFEWFNFD